MVEKVTTDPSYAFVYMGALLCRNLVCMWKGKRDQKHPIAKYSLKTNDNHQCEKRKCPPEEKCHFDGSY